MNQRGFSLVELMLVVTVMAILLAVSTMDFHRWTIKSNVEKETREMYADFARIRTHAMYTGKRHRISLDPKGYTFRSYTTSEPLTAGTEVETKVVPYEITMKDGNTSVKGTTIDFDTRGFTNDWVTLRINAPDSDAALDCLVIATGRTNMGKMLHGNCIQK